MPYNDSVYIMVLCPKCGKESLRPIENAGMDCYFCVSKMLEVMRDRQSKDAEAERIR